MCRSASIAREVDAIEKGHRRLEVRVFINRRNLFGFVLFLFLFDSWLF